MKLINFSFTAFKYLLRLTLIAIFISFFFFKGKTEINDKIASIVNLGFEWLIQNYFYIIVLMITPFFLKKLFHYGIVTAKMVRSELLHTEIMRYLSTPYIAPLHLLYMVKPPRWIKDDHEYPFRDFLYKEATDAFSQIIYVNTKIESHEPTTKRNNILAIIPNETYKHLIKSGSVIVICSLIFLLYSRFTNTEVNYAIVFLPLIIRHILKMGYIIKAIIKFGRYSVIEREIIREFGTSEPKIRWIDLYPCNKEGKYILETWKNEMTLRQYRDTQHRSSSKGADLNYEKGYDSKIRTNFELYNDLAPCPYPSMKIPDWIDEYISYININLGDNEEKTVKNSKKLSGNVIDIKEIRRSRIRY